MVDFAGNPYLNDPRFQLSDDQMRQYRLGSLGSALTSFGAGIAQSGASGQPWFAGIAPGAQMASQSLGQEQARLAQMQDAAAKWAQMEDYRKAQEKELGLKTSQLEMDQELQRRFLGGGGLDQFKAPAVQTSPTGFGGGVNPNNIGNVRPPGASTGFQQPPDFDSGVGLTVSNAKAYPKAFNGGQPMNLVQIGEKWAPKGDGANDPHQWAVNVSQYSGLPLNQPINLDDPQTAAAFARGVHGAEKGAQAVKPLEAYVPGVMKGQHPGDYMRTPQIAGGPPVIPQGGDAATGQPGTMPQPPQSAPQMPPGMPGPPPDNSGMAPYMMSPRLAPIVNFGVGQQGKQYEYQWKAYQAAQEAQKDALARMNAGVIPGAGGLPTTNLPAIQAEVAKQGAVEREKLSPDITGGQARAAGEKAAAEETAKAKAYNDIYFPQTDGPGWEKMTPQERLKTLPPNVRGVVEDMSPSGGLALSDLPARMASAGLDPSKMDVYSLAKKVYGPEFDMRQNENQKNLLTNVYEANKPEGATRLALITGTQHLATFAQLVKAQSNGDYPLLNSIVKQWNDQTGSPKFSGADALMQFLAPEAAKVVKGGSALNEKEVEDNKQTLMTTKSWPQANEILNTWMGAMLARKNGLEESLRATGVPENKIARIWGKGEGDSPSSFNKAIQSLADTTARAPESGATAQPSMTPPRGDQGQVLNDAKNAIMKGAPREKVIERLKSMGVDTKGL